MICNLKVRSQAYPLYISIWRLSLGSGVEGVNAWSRQAENKIRPLLLKSRSKMYSKCNQTFVIDAIFLNVHYFLRRLPDITRILIDPFFVKLIGFQTRHNANFPKSFYYAQYQSIQWWTKSKIEFEKSGETAIVRKGLWSFIPPPLILCLSRSPSLSELAYYLPVFSLST